MDSHLVLSVSLMDEVCAGVGVAAIHHQLPHEGDVRLGHFLWVGQQFCNMFWDGHLKS